MGVAVDKAGRDDQPVRIDHALGRRADAADLDDPAVLDADIGAVARPARAVDDHAVLDDEIESHRAPPVKPVQLRRAARPLSTGSGIPPYCCCGSGLFSVGAANRQELTMLTSSSASNGFGNTAIAPNRFANFR